MKTFPPFKNIKFFLSTSCQGKEVWPITKLTTKEKLRKWGKLSRKGDKIRSDDVKFK